ncbi:hypothetical protein ACJRO7_015285 [Eucalyptus globulus]|uniref:DUF4283 domain-containing protein n=1 Tax=Eucalyptus globulus TaxID=34317 RepID=A0ABD3L3P3_EUCGL
MVNLSAEVLQAADPKWNEFLVGDYVGKRLPFQLTEQALKGTWGPKLVDVLADDQGFYFFHVPDPVFRTKILEEGHITVARILLILRQWRPLMELKKSKQSSIPVWIRLKNLPLDLWSAPAISAIASSIGKPLHVDQRTEGKRMISFARVCVEIQANHPKVFVVEVNVDGVARSIAVEYEWKPVECLKCGVFGHNCDAPSKPSRPLTTKMGKSPALAPAAPVLDVALVPEAPATSEQGWVQVRNKKKEKKEKEGSLLGGGRLVPTNDEC